MSTPLSGGDARARRAGARGMTREDVVKGPDVSHAAVVRPSDDFRNELADAARGMQDDDSPADDDSPRDDPPAAGPPAADCGPQP